MGSRNDSAESPPTRFHCARFDQSLHVKVDFLGTIRDRLPLKPTKPIIYHPLFPIISKNTPFPLPRRRDIGMTVASLLFCPDLLQLLAPGALGILFPSGVVANAERGFSCPQVRQKLSTIKCS